MNKNLLEEVKAAKATLCSLCKSDMCEWCVVERLVQDAQDEYETDKLVFEYYEERSYSPSNPWDAPGMSIKDFI